MTLSFHPTGTQIISDGAEQAQRLPSNQRTDISQTDDTTKCHKQQN
jgi:hypothetical protein